MSDKTGKENKKALWKRLVVLLLVLVLICVAVAAFVFRDRLNLDAVRRKLRYLNVKNDAGAGQFAFDENSTNLYAPFSGGLAVASSTGLAVYNADGREYELLQTPLASPAVRAGEKTALAFDAGGNTILAVNGKSGQVMQQTTEQPITDADVSKDGCICYASSESGYKSVLYVYNDRQELIYRWLSSSQFMPICAVSEKGAWLAAVALGQNNGMFESAVSVFRTTGEEAEAVYPISNDMLYDLTFTGEQSLCAVGENAAYWFGGGEKLRRYDYEGRYLKDYDLTGDGFLTLVMNMYKAGNHCTVVTVDESGAELGSVNVDQQIVGLSAAGSYVAVLTAERLTIYDRSLEFYARTENSIGATDVVMREDGSAVLLCGDRGELYLP